MAGPEGASPDASAVEELSEQECLDLLGRQSVGRIVFVDHGQPMALPVNYVLDGRTVAFRTDPGTKFDAATLGRVAFEVDDVATDARGAWSVLVTEAIDEWSERVRSQRLEPWAAGDRHHWIALADASFSGRRIRRDRG